MLITGLDPEQRRKLDEQLAWPVTEDEVRDTWGTSPEAVAGQRAVMGMLGGGEIVGQTEAS